jgi:glycosyltransferase involved in cell wall biosynthesis
MLVSCIMPTMSSRRRFIQAAVRWFLAQDYPDKELIIVDDGELPIFLADDSRIRLHFMRDKVSLGDKRNFACDMAKGDIIAHWDDDDWYAPWRLRQQVMCLRHHFCLLSGLEQPLFYDQQANKAHRLMRFAVQQPWVYGATMCYRKSAWAERKFAPINSGEDSNFVWKFKENQVLKLGQEGMYVGLLHRSNTSPLCHQRHLLRPIEISRIREVMGEDSFGGHPVGTKPYQERNVARGDGLDRGAGG